jgi:hypothetical protein
MSEKSSEKQESTNAMIAVETDYVSAIERLGYLSGCRNQNAMIARAARAAGISFSMAKRIFYGETTDPKTSVSIKIANALAKKQEDKASAQASRAAAGIANLAELFRQTDPDRARALLSLAFGDIGGESGNLLRAGHEGRAVAEG